MFEKEIKFICDFCLNKINKAGSVLTFEKIKGIEIHPAILKFISAEIDYQVYQDRQTLLQKSSFDYSGAEISKYFRMISYEIKKSKRISENEINDLITKAVAFNFEFTTKPNETLTNFIFREAESLSPEDLYMLLDYPFYYSYLKQILISYLDKKQLLTVEKKEFEYLLNKIDSELFPVKTNELVDSALDAIADFYNIGAVLRSQIPVQAAEIYLKEKKLNDHLTRLQSVLSQTTKMKYEVDEIKKIIYSSAPITEQLNSASEDTSLQQTKDVVVSDDLNPELKTTVEEDLLPELPTVNETEEIKTDEFEVTSANSDESVDFSNDLELEKDIETFPLESDTLEELPEEKSVDDSIAEYKADQDILSFLSNKEIEKIISSIFNEDKEDFAITIETLNDCKSFEKATEILKSLYTTYNVNPYSRDAIILTNAVAKYFTLA
jgi:hypothetical protein